jgi:hypothetical protein
MADKIRSLGPPPVEIELVYKRIGNSHVFTAPQVGGFYYGSSSLEKTFNEAAKALSMHVSRLYHVKAEYSLGSSLSAFEHHLVSDDDDDASELLVKNVVIATKASENGDISCH